MKSIAHSQMENADERMGIFLDFGGGADRRWNPDEPA
jgi:hypothetical protein